MKNVEFTHEEVKALDNVLMVAFSGIHASALMAAGGEHFKTALNKIRNEVSKKPSKLIIDTSKLDLADLMILIEIGGKIIEE